jgi:predicted alpha/beta superfamily hydrolase
VAVLGRREAGEPDSGRESVWQDYPLAGTGEPGTISLRVAATLPTRDVLVALPPGYEGGKARYPVIYMHDGQNLFDPATSFAGDWGLVETLNTLAVDGVEAIVVGIPNRGGRRRHEYTPFRDLLHGGGGGDRYLAFLVGTVKPLVDGSFRTRPGRADTVIAGASLGGLISLYALYRHAGIFGAASVQSPALWFARRAIFRFVEKQPAPADSRISLDCGSEEGGDTVENARAMRKLLIGAGYVEGETLSYVEEEGAGHTEQAWGRRFREALPFLLGSR